jgi:hypothetical protein
MTSELTRRAFMGGIFLGKEDRDTADNINAILEYPGDLLATFEANVTDMIRNENENMVFMGTGGAFEHLPLGLSIPVFGKGRRGGEGRFLSRAACRQLARLRAQSKEAILR